MGRWTIVHQEALGVFGTEKRWTLRAALDEVARRNAVLRRNGLEPCWQVAPR